jgi:hypothetical protein
LTAIATSSSWVARSLRHDQAKNQGCQSKKKIKSVAEAEAKIKSNNEI